MLNMFFIMIFMYSIFNAIDVFPLQKRMIDMSHTYDERANTDFRSQGYKMRIEQKDGSLGHWLQLEDISTGTHQGTHMDAPSYVIDGGLDIDQLSIENFIVHASVIDISDRAISNPDTQFFVDDFLEFERNTGCSLDDTFVLLRTGWDQRWGNTMDYMGTDDGDVTKLHVPGLNSTAARWLVENRLIKGVGIDTFSIDGSSQEFLSHTILLGENKYVLENLINIGRIPTCGATLYVMPIKLRGTGGAPTRVIADFNEAMEFGWNDGPWEGKGAHFRSAIWPDWNFSSWNWPVFNHKKWPDWNFTIWEWQHDTFNNRMSPNRNFTTWKDDVFNKETWPNFNYTTWTDDIFNKKMWSYWNYTTWTDNVFKNEMWPHLNFSTWTVFNKEM